jgi:uncharacterized protein (TIGR02271 family)
MSADETVIPVVQEALLLHKKEVPTGTLRVKAVTDNHQEFVKTDLAFSDVTVTRVHVGREIDAMPDVRVEDNVTIIPVVEERLIVEKRLFLKEELHLTHTRGTEAVEIPVTVRKQRVEVTREPAQPTTHEEKAMTSDTMTSDYGSRRLTAFFDRREDAEQAMSRLRTLGVSDASMRLTGGEEATGRLGSSEPGFWESIADFFFPPMDRSAYEEGLRRGGWLLTVGSVPASLYEQAVDILDSEGSIDLDERSESWRAEGWTGATAGSDTFATGTAEGSGITGDSYRARETGTTSVTGSAVTGSGVTGSAEPGTLGGEDIGRMSSSRELEGDEVIPVVEERLRVGKRDADLGRVRVRSYVVEEPVSEDVSLRSERVEIERRPVDRPAGAEAFVDRTIEAEERAEEAVVSKEARVTEEIGLRRESEERTETVSDTVRHTEVEVEDERDAGRGTTRHGA